MLLAHEQADDAADVVLLDSYWEGRLEIETVSAFIAFVDEDGRHVKVSGNVVVEDL